ncbi:MAG TPA: hypothetical protein VHI93_05395 [Candidatus Thermoplasmatota archaeon]|nr:hypothetical protein [Candidatus Thermoplasmatota archaeon]
MASKPAGKKSASAKKAAPGKAPAPKERSAPDPIAQRQARARAVDRQLEKAEHQHQDPRGLAQNGFNAPGAPAVDPRTDQAPRKNRAVPRLDKVVNWFRRGRGR